MNKTSVYADVFLYMEGTMIRTRLNELRNEMHKEGITYYYIPTSDFHESEYVGDYFKAREYMSGFTGSAGVLLVGLEEAYLWTDGRYYIQAEAQLQNSGIELMRSGEVGVLSLEEKLRSCISSKDVIGFDGRVVNATLGDSFKAIGCEIKCGLDLVERIWMDRPSLPMEKAYVLSEKYSGKSYLDKLKDLVKEFKDTTILVESSLDAIAWFLNIRGNDVFASPVVLSFMIVSKDKTMWFVDECKLSNDMIDYLKENHIEVLPYANFYDELSKIENSEVYLNKNVLNYQAYSMINSSNTIINKVSPIMAKKACKNEIELENLRKAHIEDGVAITKFMYELKELRHNFSEVSVAERLEQLRSQRKNYVSISFNTIAGYREHAAMMHYSATPQSDYVVENKDLLLVDSGGHYLEGTTDITRTFIMGEITPEMKRDYTLVLKGMIALSRQKFLEGCSGMNLDILARQYIWNQGLDYRCGTGHGIGYLLNVHEGPHGIRWKRTVAGSELVPLKLGMVVTNEPGVYEEGKYGIRIENELVVSKYLENEYGAFFEFETITYAPIDLEGIDVTLLTNEEKKFLNEYHEMVYNKLKDHLSEDEKAWLYRITREI